MPNCAPCYESKSTKKEIHMSKIFRPKNISTSIRNDSRFKAEVKVFDIIKEQSDKRLVQEQEQYEKNFGKGGIVEILKPQ